MIRRFPGWTVVMPIVAMLCSACAGQGPQPTPPASPPSFAGTAAAGTSGWPTYHRDASRTGLDPTSPSLLAIRRAWVSSALDGEVYAEPLIIGDRVFVATENDSVYALDAASGRTLWRTHLGEPVSRSSLACGDIDPLGITGTPVGDTRTGLLWVAPFIQPGRHQLVALDLSSGSVRSQRAIDPPQADPMFLQQRAALAVSAGTVYVAFGGLFGDCGSYNGWVVGAKADGSGSLMTYRTNTDGRAGIWGPSGPAVDAAGDLYVSTGNGDSTGTFDFGDAVVRLGPDLRLLDWFAPSNWADLNAGDTDLGTMGPALLGNGLVFQAGKDGIGYLLQAGHLGGLSGQAFSAHICSSAWGGTAYMSPFVYVGCSDGLVALRLGAGTTFSVAWRGRNFWAEPPIVAGGLLWTVDRGAASLNALDPTSGQERFRQSLGAAAHFTTPAAGDGRVYVAAGASIVAFTPSP